MIDNVKTTPTQAMQLWIAPTLGELGFVPKKWGLPKGDAAGTVTYANPITSWIDSSLVLPSETWQYVRRGPRPARSYPCGVLEPLPVRPPYSDHGFPARARAEVTAGSAECLRTTMGFYWPKGTTPEYPNGFDLGLLSFPADPCAPWVTKLGFQHFSANVAPAELYTLARPGSERFRIAPGDSGFKNLVLCGDWTDYGLNAGFVEGAVQSGMLAALAVTEPPKGKLGATEAPAPVTRSPDRSPDVQW